MLTPRQQYDKVRETLISWINWKGKSDVLGLMLGLGDYWTELRLLEVELGLPATKVSELLNW
jgi:hypothetical protein